MTYLLSLTTKDYLQFCLAFELSQICISYNNLQLCLTKKLFHHLGVTWHGPERVVLAFFQFVDQVSGEHFAGRVAAAVDAVAFRRRLVLRDVRRPIHRPEPHEVVDRRARIAQTSVMRSLEVDDLLDKMNNTFLTQILGVKKSKA